MKEERKVQKFLGVELFTWVECDIVDTAVIQFYGVRFSFGSMQKCNGMIASMELDGTLEICSEDGKVMWRGYPIDIPEFKKLLNL